MKHHLDSNAIECYVITYFDDSVAAAALVWTFGIVDGALAEAIDERRDPFLPESCQELLASLAPQNLDRNIFQVLAEREPLKKDEN